MLSAAASASGGFSENSTVWKFTKSAAFLLPSLRTFTSLRSSYSHRWQGPSKVHGWGKWKNSSGFVSVLRLRLEPLCVACAAFETTFLAAHWQLVCPGVTVWLFQVCPSPCGRRHKHACSHTEKKLHVFKAWIWMRIILFISTNFRKKNWQTFSSKETLIPKTNSYLGAQGHI